MTESIKTISDKINEIERSIETILGLLFPVAETITLTAEGVEALLKELYKLAKTEVEPKSMPTNLTRKETETNDNLRAQIATLTACCDILTTDNRKLRHTVRGMQHRTNRKLLALELKIDNLRSSSHQNLERVYSQHLALMTMVTDGLDAHAQALVQLDEKSANAFNAVSKNEEAVAQAIVSLRKQLGHPFPESSIFDGLLG
ncbi:MULTISPECIES: hypothetical protein [unclassified Microcoleus]|uniref:hypothetical protein n=1 Tax=unclassified Microcoleus TaxID=2642155 RepID=UPI002FD46663